MAFVDVSPEKKYYSKLDVRLQALNSQDTFYKEISSSIRMGKNEVYQKRMREAQVFDNVWIDNIDIYIINLDKIVRNPKTFMMPMEDVVRIDQAKKLNARTISHLSSHTQFVQDIDKKTGIVKPAKVLTTIYEDEIAIYENRFIVTLINKLAAFVEKRYDIVKDHMVCNQIDRLNVHSEFNWRNFDIECTVDIKVTEDVDDEVNRKNKMMLEKLILIRKYAQGFINSAFYKEVRSRANFISPPILKTNIILKNVDYNQCYKLWLFLDSYRQIGFEIDVVEKNLTFDDKYVDKIMDLIVVNYSAIVANQEERAQDYHLQPYKVKTIKQHKVVETLVNENLSAGTEKVEEASANEYFYQRTKKQMSKTYEELLSSGKGYNASLVSIFKQMVGISNSVYKDLFNKLDIKPDKEASADQLKKDEYEVLRRKKTVLSSIVFVKERDAKSTKKELNRILKKMEKMKKEEEEFKLRLKTERKLNLAKARIEKSQKVYTEQELQEIEFKKLERKRKQEETAARKAEKESRRKELFEAEQLLVKQELSSIGLDLGEFGGEEPALDLTNINPDVNVEKEIEEFKEEIDDILVEGSDGEDE
jgi:hypothetical protein